jgi:hypothetical protein
VNNIHLQQVQQNSDPEQENKDKQDSAKSEEPSTPSPVEQKSPA